MAKQRGPVASYFSGKVGEVVGASLKGGEYTTRTYKKHIKNPNTLRQRVSRLRMSTAAKIAAGLAPAIQAGFGKAAGNTHMYPRNMFVRDIVKFSENSPLKIAGETAEIQFSELKVSERIGISTVPVIGAPSFETAGKVGMTVTGQPVIDVLPAGKMGIVVAVYSPVSEACAIGMVDAPTEGTATVDVTVPSSWSGETVYVYAFYKWIPESGNDVATDDEPWKYPAETGATVFVGTGNVA